MIVGLKGLAPPTSEKERSIVGDGLNDFFLNLTESVLSFGGTIDKFSGELAVVFFKDSKAQGADEKKALCCALEIRNAYEKMNRDRHQDGFGPLGIGIGIGTGEILANRRWGQGRLLEESFTGEPLGVAKALVGEAQKTPHKILAGNTVMPDNIVYAESEPLKVSGRESPVRIFEIQAFKPNADAGEPLRKTLP